VVQRGHEVRVRRHGGGKRPRGVHRQSDLRVLHAELVVVPEVEGGGTVDGQRMLREEDGEVALAADDPAGVDGGLEVPPHRTAAEMLEQGEVSEPGPRWDTAQKHALVALAREADVTIEDVAAGDAVEEEVDELLAAVPVLDDEGAVRGVHVRGQPPPVRGLRVPRLRQKRGEEEEEEAGPLGGGEEGEPVPDRCGCRGGGGVGADDDLVPLHSGGLEGGGGARWPGGWKAAGD